MTTEPFIPHADSIQTAWVLMCQQSRISTQPPVEELEAEFDRFIAQVKRDAARSALNGLVDSPAHVVAFACAEHTGYVKDVIRSFRDTHYPETEDQT